MDVDSLTRCRFSFNWGLFSPQTVFWGDTALAITPWESPDYVKAPALYICYVQDHGGLLYL